MLIDYSERAYDLLRRPLTKVEKADLYDVFRRVGEGLAIPELPTAPIAEAEALGVFYREQIAPFLRDGSAANSPLVSATRAAALFQSVKARIPPAAHEIVDALERFCQQRRQWDQQARLHFWLHNWLWVHFPLSVALLVLMVVHVFVALKFW